MASGQVLKRCLKTQFSNLSCNISASLFEMENIGRGTKFQEKDHELGAIKCEF